MPSIVTPILQAILEGGFQRASTLELRLADGRVLYWATLPLFHAGHLYEGQWLAKADGTEQAVSVAVDRAVVWLHNADERFSLMIVDARRLFESATAIVGAAFARKDDYERNGAYAQWGWKERFRGRVRLPGGEKPQAKLEIVSDREAAGTLVSESYSANCELAYKGEECGHTGALPTCDHTLKGPNGCERHGHAHRYPGASDEPDVVAAPPGGSGDPGGGIGGDIIGGGRCFPAGTLVAVRRREMAAIETFRAEDEVLCFDPEKRRIVRGAVQDVHRHEGVSEFIDVHLAGRLTVRATPEHPFFVLDGRFVPTGKLEAGQWIGVLGDDGCLRGAQVIYTTPALTDPQTVYNLCVAPFPTYFADGAAVHNLKREDIIGGIVL